MGTGGDTLRMQFSILEKKMIRTCLTERLSALTIRKQVGFPK